MEPNSPEERTVYLMNGLSGAGKTWHAERKVQLNAQHGVKTTRISTNDWFNTADGKWVFDESQLEHYHQLAFEEYLTALEAQDPVIIVDNTNLYERHRVPYQEAAYNNHYRYVNVLVGAFDPTFAKFAWLRSNRGLTWSKQLGSAARYEKPLGHRILIPKEACGWSPT